MKLFANALIALDLGYSIDFKKKSVLRKKIVEEGGTISYIVTRKCKYVVTSDPEKCDVSSKCRMAAKYGLPVLSLDFIWDSLDAEKVQAVDSYIVGGKSKILDFKSGKISYSKQRDENKRTKKTLRYNPRNVKIWTNQDVNLPAFDEEGHVVAKYAFYTKMNTDDLYVIEVHAPPLSQERLMPEENENVKTPFEFKYRITLQHGPEAKLEEGHTCRKDFRYAKTGEQALAVFAMLCEDFNKKTEYIQMMFPIRDVGSPNLQKLIAKQSFAEENFNEQVQDLVEHVWREAMTELSDCLGDVKKIKADQLEKAEAILSKIRDAMRAAASDKEISSLIDSFYDVLPHKVKEAHPNTKNYKQWLMTKQDMCQLIKDVISVNEITDFEMRPLVDAKYDALRCKICHFDSKDNKRRFVEEMVTSAIREGLLLPKVIVDEYGGKRSDIGLLGSGIYFASDPSTSIKYSTASRTKGTRLLLINEVALGRYKDFLAHSTDLVAAPEGFDSTHGVSKKMESSSAFEDDEYVVYNVNQQRVRYLVEFKLEDDTVKPIDDIEMEIRDFPVEEPLEISLCDVKDVVDPLSKVKSGLIGKGDQQVDLRGVHIRAKLVDLAAQVVVLQEYYNGSDESIEAKYVFPLDDAAAVCGFEAFINGKHIVGEVKEKETAHKEYKQAIKEGHGAYLMDQDEEAPDVFTVSVGNLPAKACVLIKITYVAELQVEGELINFRLPASVAPWKEDAALKKQTQQTASKAYVEMFEGQEYGSGFQLLIGLAEIHVPRMWVERHPKDPDHRACMLTFYPEFEANENEAEVIIFLDCSNSMKGSASVDAKKVALLLLAHLPSGTLFNVVRFGTDWEELFPASYAISDENCKKAREFVTNSYPERGNTNVIQPLHSIFLMPNSKFMRNVFLISDGHINDDEVILKSAFMNHDNVRIFTFGVSSTCNSFCLKAIARVSGGAFEFFNQATKSKWEPKVKDQLRKSRQPGLTSVSVKWEQHDDNLPPPTQAPKQITALYNGSRQVVYGFVPNCTMATLTASVGGQELSTLVSTSDLGMTDGLIVHRLSARAIIRDWEDGVLSQDRTGHEIAKMDMENFVIDMSKQYSIVTKLTSFIAVEKRDENEKDIDNKGPTMKELVQREGVDILEYMGWTHEPAIEKLPTGYLILTLTKSVNERHLPEKFSDKLSFMGEKCRNYLKDLELCSTDAFDIANTMMDAFDLNGEPQKAAEFGAELYEESINRLDEITEEKYENVISRLHSLKKKINEFDENVNLSLLPETKAAAQSINVVTLTGKTISIALDSDMSVYDLQKKIQDKEGIPPEQQRFICKGMQLESSRNLKDYKIRPDDSIHLVLRLRGGPDLDEDRQGRRPYRCGLLPSDSDESSDDLSDSWSCASDDLAMEFHSKPQEMTFEEAPLKKRRTPSAALKKRRTPSVAAEEFGFDDYDESGLYEQTVCSLTEPLILSAIDKLEEAPMEKEDLLMPSKRVDAPEDLLMAFDGVEYSIKCYDACAEESEEDEEMGFDLFDDYTPEDHQISTKVCEKDTKADAIMPFETSEARMPEASFTFGGSLGSCEETGGSVFDSYETRATAFIGRIPAPALSLPKQAAPSGLFGSTSAPPPQHGASFGSFAQAFAPQPPPSSDDTALAAGFGSLAQTFATPPPPPPPGAAPFVLGFGSPATAFVPPPPPAHASHPVGFGLPAKASLGSPPPPSRGAARKTFGFGSPATAFVPPPPPAPASQPVGFGSPAKASLGLPPPPSRGAAPQTFGFGSPAKVFVPQAPLSATSPQAFMTVSPPLSPPPPVVSPPPAAVVFKSSVEPSVASPPSGAAPCSASAAFGSSAKPSQSPSPQPSTVASAAFKSPPKPCSLPPPPLPSRRLICDDLMSDSPEPSLDSESLAKATSRKTHGHERKFHKKTIELEPESMEHTFKTALKTQLAEKNSVEPVSQKSNLMNLLKLRSGGPRGLTSAPVGSVPKVSPDSLSDSPIKSCHEEEEAIAIPQSLSRRARLMQDIKCSAIVPRFASSESFLQNQSKEIDSEKSEIISPSGHTVKERYILNSYMSSSEFSKINTKAKGSLKDKGLEERSNLCLSDDHPEFYKEKLLAKKRRKPVEQKRSFSLARYGIGVDLGLIRQPSYRLKVSDIAAILKLQNSNGSWEFSANIDRLIGINSEACLNILKTSGLHSLGKITANEVEMLLATLLVLMALSEILFPRSFPLDVSELHLAKLNSNEFDRDAAKRELESAGLSHENIENLFVKMLLASDFCHKIDQCHPLVYSTLELGPNWLYVAAALMNVIKKDLI